jgi:AcrR family transcriptional regulator
MPATRTYHHKDLSKALEKSALKSIKKIGVNNLSLRQLAKDCGVSPTAVYRHFNSKEHLIAHLSKAAYIAFSKTLLHSSEPHKKLDDKFLAQGIAYVEFALDNPAYFDLMFGIHINIERYPETHRAAEQSYKALSQLVDQLSPNIKGAKQQEYTVHAIWSQVHGLALLMQKGLIAPGKNRRLTIKKIILADT